MFPSLHISASPNDLSIFLPLYLSEPLHVECKCTRNWAFVSSNSEMTSDWSLIIFSFMWRIYESANPQLPLMDHVFIASFFAKALSRCWVNDFPWHYAFHIAGPWAVPGVWSCFMTSCPRAREAKLPISCWDCADRMNSVLGGVFFIFIFISKYISNHPTFESHRLRLYKSGFAVLMCKVMQFVSTSAFHVHPDRQLATLTGVYLHKWNKTFLTP